MEASYWHLPKAPLHMTLQKVMGLVIGLGRTTQETTIRKYFQFHGKSRGKLSKWTERDVTTLSSAAKRLQIRFKMELDLAERMRKL